MEVPKINLQNPEDLTQQERRELACLYQEARANGDTIPGLTIRHIGQEAWVAANQFNPINRTIPKGDHELHI